jgi:hypothetical protein
MKSGLDSILDAVLLIMMLAVGLPVLLFCFNIFLNEQTYGFDTFREKSVQEREHISVSYWGNDINGKVLWTDAHRALLDLVDDRTAPALRLDRGQLLAQGYNKAVALPAGMAVDWTTPRYHLKWHSFRTINTAVYKRLVKFYERRRDAVSKKGVARRLIRKSYT